MHNSHNLCENEPKWRIWSFSLSLVYGFRLDTAYFDSTKCFKRFNHHITDVLLNWSCIIIINYGKMSQKWGFWPVHWILLVWYTWHYIVHILQRIIIRRTFRELMKRACLGNGFWSWAGPSQGPLQFSTSVEGRVLIVR